MLVRPVCGAPSGTAGRGGRDREEIAPSPTAVVHASAAIFFRGVSARCSFTGPWSSGGSLTDATQRRAFSISGPSE
jgi:hypothetical protein